LERVEIEEDKEVEEEGIEGPNQTNNQPKNQTKNQTNNQPNNQAILYYTKL
jgi:hypothetical protein